MMLLTHSEDGVLMDSRGRRRSSAVGWADVEQPGESLPLLVRASFRADQLRPAASAFLSTPHALSQSLSSSLYPSDLYKSCGPSSASPDACGGFPADSVTDYHEQEQRVRFASL